MLICVTQKKEGNRLVSIAWFPHACLAVCAPLSLISNYINKRYIKTHSLSPKTTANLYIIRRSVAFIRSYIFLRDTF